MAESEEDEEESDDGSDVDQNEEVFEDTSRKKSPPSKKEPSHATMSKISEEMQQIPQTGLLSPRSKEHAASEGLLDSQQRVNESSMPEASKPMSRPASATPKRERQGTALERSAPDNIMLEPPAKSRQSTPTERSAVKAELAEEGQISDI